MRGSFQTREKNKKEKLYANGTGGLIEVTWGREGEKNGGGRIIPDDGPNDYLKGIYIHQLNIHSPYGETMMLPSSFDEVDSLPLKIWKERNVILPFIEKEKKQTRGGRDHCPSSSFNSVPTAGQLNILKPYFGDCLLLSCCWWREGTQRRKSPNQQ